MKPGKLTCGGIVAIMLVLPNNFWQGSEPRATTRFIVREPLGDSSKTHPRELRELPSSGSMPVCAASPAGAGRRTKLTKRISLPAPQPSDRNHRTEGR